MAARLESAGSLPEKLEGNLLPYCNHWLLAGPAGARQIVEITNNLNALWCVNHGHRLNFF
jgi:hypothetical protein